MSNPMQRFIDGAGAFIARVDEVTADLDLTDHDSATEFLQAVQEMQTMNWATGASLLSRNGLLKKIMNEIH